MTQERAAAAGTAPSVPMTVEQRAAFERDGYLIIRGALAPDEIAGARDALDRVYAAMARAGSLGPDGSMHLLSAVANCPEVAGLIDHPATFGYVWSILGWNIHIYHSHLDVHPPIRAALPFRFEWHQDGGRQNRELETTPRPRLSVKLAYWLSDVSEPGRGNLKVVPGSHVVDWIDGPPRRDIQWPDPAGAIEVTAEPGDAVFFDRRLWHTRSRNYSQHTRKAVFLSPERDDLLTQATIYWVNNSIATDALLRQRQPLPLARRPPGSTTSTSPRTTTAVTSSPGKTPLPG